MSDQQQTFEDAIDRALRAGGTAVLATVDAAGLALALGDQLACGALNAYTEATAELIDLIGREKEAVHARLAETLPEGERDG